METVSSSEEEQGAGPWPVQELRHPLQVVDALVRDMEFLLSTTTENCVRFLHAYRYAGDIDLLGHTLTEEESGCYYDWYGLLFPRHLPQWLVALFCQLLSRTVAPVCGLYRLLQWAGSEAVLQLNAEHYPVRRQPGLISNRFIIAIEEIHPWMDPSPSEWKGCGTQSLPTLSRSGDDAQHNHPNQSRKDCGVAKCRFRNRWRRLGVSRLCANRPHRTRVWHNLQSELILIRITRFYWIILSFCGAVTHRAHSHHVNTLQSSYHIHPKCPHYFSNLFCCDPQSVQGRALSDHSLSSLKAVSYSRNRRKNSNFGYWMYKSPFRAKHMTRIGYHAFGTNRISSVEISGRQMISILYWRIEDLWKSTLEDGFPPYSRSSFKDNWIWQWHHSETSRLQSWKYRSTHSCHKTRSIRSTSCQPATW